MQCRLFWFFPAISKLHLKLKITVLTTWWLIFNYFSSTFSLFEILLFDRVCRKYLKAVARVTARTQLSSECERLSRLQFQLLYTALSPEHWNHWCLRINIENTQQKNLFNSIRGRSSILFVSKVRIGWVSVLSVYIWISCTGSAPHQPLSAGPTLTDVEDLSSELTIPPRSHQLNNPSWEEEQLGVVSFLVSCQCWWWRHWCIYFILEFFTEN